MGHRSRLYSAYVDVPRPRYDATVSFYGELLGKPAVTDPDDPDYTSYGDAETGIQLYVQSVGNDAPRVHLDFETDDVEAEVARLTALGATEVERIKTWVVMQDPVGTVFCVIRVQDTAAFEAHATAWP
ncbi:MAG TPA: VOC family protein [Mycobacteriales bacterium]|nr:VOC family protein [Mycobacteriales bacterium]